MTPTRLRAHNLGVLRDVDLDLSALPEGIVAIVGPNGAGKSTLLDAIGFAPFFRAWSSKPGELKDYCAGPARLDLDLDADGHAYALRLRIDPTAKGGAGQTDATITRDGVPLTDGTRATDYDLAVCDWPATAAKAATRGAFPSRRMLLASAFAAQDRSGGFASLGPAERKALFGELLGTEEHQERSARAKAKGADLDVEIAAIARDLTAIESSRTRRAELLLTVADGEREHTAAAEAEALADRSLEAAAAELAAARAALDVADRDARAIDARRAELSRDMATVGAELSRTSAALDDIDDLVGREPAIRARAAQLVAATEALAAARATYATAAATRTAADLALTQARAARAQASADVARLELEGARLAADRDALPAAELRATRATELRAAIDSGAAALSTTETQAREATVALDAATRASERADEAVTSAERRAGLLEGVPCAGTWQRTHQPIVETLDRSSCRFLGDATAARDALPALREAAAMASAPLDSLAYGEQRILVSADRQRSTLSTLRTEAATLRTAEGDLAVLRTRIEAGERAAAALDAARARLAEAESSVDRATAAATEAAAALTRAEAEGRATKETERGLGGADLELRRLDVARGSAAHLRTARDVAETRRAAVEGALASLGACPDLSARRRAVSALVESEALARLDRDARRSEARAAAARLERTRGALDAMGDLDAQAGGLTATRDRLALRRAGYAEVERAFGRDGIQALEIDAAGPEVSRLTNELLSTVSGGRFAVSLVTLQEASGARKQKEVFDLRVLDGEREHAGIAFDRLSIGEQCLVGEALKLAIAVHNTRRSGRELRTLYRDEGDRDLDPERRAAYPAMLRKAMELGGFTRCYLISHSPEVWAQADAVIRVEGGRAWIER